MQVKKDLVDGHLVCNESMAALLSSYIIQGIYFVCPNLLRFVIFAIYLAECGDYNIEEYSNHLYISKFKLIPNQDEEFEIKVMENHRKLMYVFATDFSIDSHYCIYK